MSLLSRITIARRKKQKESMARDIRMSQYGQKHPPIDVDKILDETFEVDYANPLNCKRWCLGQNERLTNKDGITQAGVNRINIWLEVLRRCRRIRQIICELCKSKDCKKASKCFDLKPEIESYTITISRTSSSITSSKYSSYEDFDEYSSDNSSFDDTSF